MHDAADGGLDVDGRIMALVGQVTRQHDVPVQNGARVVCDRILLVITFCQHRVKRGDRSASAIAVAGPLHQQG